MTTPHGMLWYPFPWGERFRGYKLNSLEIEWLLVIPITQEEFDFIALRGPGFNGAGVEKLIDAFDNAENDIFDLTRLSAV